MPKGFSSFTEGLRKKFILYTTKIVDIGPGDVILNSGGWRTAHTKKCMNLALKNTPYCVFQRKGSWYVKNTYNDIVVEFRDGIVFGKDV